MATGIYRIKIGEYFYIGQSTMLSKRKSVHLHHLRKGTHSNRKMQNVYNKYKDFSFKVMLNCDADQLDMLEQSALDICYGDWDCMNLARYAESPARGLKHTAKTRKLISKANQGKNNPWYGKKHSSEARKLMSKAKQGHKNNMKKTIYSFVHNDGSIENCTQYELRMKYNLDPSGVSQIVSGKRKTHKGWRIK